MVPNMATQVKVCFTIGFLSTLRPVLPMFRTAVSNELGVGAWVVGLDFVGLPENCIGSVLAERIGGISTFGGMISGESRVLLPVRDDPLLDGT
jgi:hypothetical protein